MRKTAKKKRKRSRGIRPVETIQRCPPAEIDDGAAQLLISAILDRAMLDTVHAHMGLLALADEPDDASRYKAGPSQAEKNHTEIYKWWESSWAEQLCMNVNPVRLRERIVRAAEQVYQRKMAFHINAKRRKDF